MIILLLLSLAHLHVVTAYDPDSQFTISALSRLEDVGIPILTVLNTNIQVLQQVLSTFVENVYMYTHPTSLLTAWLSCDDISSHCSATWTNLLLVVCRLNLDEIAGQIKTYLSRAIKQEDNYSDSEVSKAEFESENESESNKPDSEAEG